MSETKPEGADGAVAIGVDKPELVKMQAPEDCTSVSVAGMQFDIPASGIVECPGHIAQQLASHGFTVVTPARKAARAKVQS